MHSAQHLGDAHEVGSYPRLANFEGWGRGHNGLANFAVMYIETVYLDIIKLRG